MKTIFNLSFEESKNVIYKLKSITTSNPELAKLLRKNVLMYITPSLFTVFILLEIGVYITHPKNSIGKWVMILTGGLWLTGIFFMTIFPLFKHKNFASMYKNVILGTSGLLWAGGLSMAYPLTTTTLKNAGVISFGLQVASLIILICFFFYLGVTSKTKNIKNRKEKEKNKGAILKISVLEGIVLIGALIAAEFHNNFIFNFEYIFEKLIVFAVFG
ncbi:hypothetical protein [Lactobacillus sp. PV012]|uniref:hypothetical protein n=1 Tax=Lactobacillus sp. PV012 TaxID=2594494 RepID=UPI00223F3CBE|nr:hypothetical protein [Lactobacillus sp. PV012]QNQ81992.1 hypothetical protein FP433_02580 [Lactobacillus sp. PV012]